MKVAVLMGSANDQDKMAPAPSRCSSAFGVEADERVMSAHRTPDRGRRVLRRRPATTAIGAIICGAGMAAHLGGAVAAHTTLPVIGVPLSGSALNGVDAVVRRPCRCRRASRSPPSPSTARPTPPCWWSRSSPSPMAIWRRSWRRHREQWKAK